MKADNSIRTVQFSALAVVLIGGLLNYWQYNLRSSAEERLHRLQAETPDRKKVESDLATSKQSVQDYSTELVHLEQGVPTNAYVATLLKELEALGFQKRLIVTGVVPVQSPPSAPQEQPKDGATKPVSKPYDEQDIDITGRGDFQAVLDTVMALQAFPKIIAVKTVSVTPKQDPNNKSINLLEVTISIKAYIFKEGEGGVAKEVSALNPNATTTGAAK